MAEKIVSEILMRATIFKPTTNMFASTALLRILGLTLDDGMISVPITAYFLTGSSSDLNIKPLLSCIDDIDIMFRTNRDVAIPVSCAIPDGNFLKSLSKSVALFYMKPSSYPGYVHLHEEGSLEWDETSDSYFLLRNDKGLMSDALYHLTTPEEPYRVYEKGPSMRVHGGHYKSSFQGQEIDYNLLFDIVSSIPCPYWPPQATAFRTRVRRHGWPSKAIVDEIVSKGCDIVHISHVHRRKVSDRTQWRLSFSRAETKLLHTWTDEQKIVLHMLRYFYRTHFPEGGAISSYHLKTLMLWSCEQQPSNFWRTSSIVCIASELLARLVRSLRQRRLDNYFTSGLDCNCNLLIDEHDSQDSSGKLYDELITTLLPFTCTETLAMWFLKNYIAVAVSQYSDKQLTQLFDKAVSCLQSERTCYSTIQQAFVDRFLTEYKSAKMSNTVLEFAHCIELMFLMCSNFKMSVESCKLTLNKLPDSDHRLPDLYAAFILLEAAYQIDQTKSLPEHETINLVIEVLFRSEKDKTFCFYRYHKETAVSYFNQALVFLISARNTKGFGNLLMELAKSCLIKSLVCTHGSSLSCAVNAYLAALFWETRDFQLVKECVKYVVTKKDHSSCSNCTMQPKLLPVIDLLCDSYRLTPKSEKHDKTISASTEEDIEASTYDATPELFAHLLQSYIEDRRLPSGNEFAELSGELAHIDSGRLLRQTHTNSGHMPNTETKSNVFDIKDETQVQLRSSCSLEVNAERNELSRGNNDVLGNNNSKKLIYTALQSQNTVTRKNSFFILLHFYA